MHTSKRLASDTGVIGHDHSGIDRRLPHRCGSLYLFDSDDEVFFINEQKPGDFRFAKNLAVGSNSGGFTKNSGTVGQPFALDVQLAERLLYDQRLLLGFDQHREIRNPTFENSYFSWAAGLLRGKMPVFEQVSSYVICVEFY